MGSSKKKSSFRIDDLLQHPVDIDSHSHLKRQMFAPATTSKDMDLSAQPAKNRNGPVSASPAPITAPHFHRLVKEMLEVPTSDVTSSTTHTMHQSTNTSKAPGLPISHSAYSDISPHKPMPMYAPPSPMSGALLDMSKPNYCFPMPMPMTPPFSHAATAYLEHYANTFHKGK